jgi:hypothetical protein
MGQYAKTPSYVAAYVATTGVPVVPKGDGSVTLASGTTYYFPLGGAEAPLIGAQLIGDAAIIITAARIECTFVEAARSSHFDATAGLWVIENPPTAYVPTTGAGWTATLATLAVAGGAIGSAIWDVGNVGSKRARLAVVVGGTGGVATVATHGKA